MVGDEIFQLKDYLMHPYPGTRSGKPPTDQAVFDYQLSRARRVIETSFDILVARWRLFRKPIVADKKNITSYILAGAALHNYLQQTENVSYWPHTFVDSKDNGEFRPGDWRRIVHGDAGCFMPCGRYQGSRNENNAMKMRDDLEGYVNSDIGSFPWQSNYVLRTTGRVSDRD